MRTLIKNATVVTLDPKRTIHANGAVVVEGQRILAVGPSAELAQRHANADTVLDAAGKLVLPGFVSAHNHLGYAVFRGRAEDVGYSPIQRLYLPMSAIIRAEERRSIGALAVTELLRGGVTTILEMEEDAEQFAPFIESSGIRASIGEMVNDLDLDALTQGKTVFDEKEREQQLDRAIGLVERWHGRADGRIQAVVAANGLSSSSRPLLRGLRDAADRMKVRLSIHLGFGETELVRNVHGQDQFDYAMDMGMLAPDVVAVHCYDVSDSEVEILAGSGAHLAHCPLMNQFRGEIAPVDALRALGMNVGLGIDNYFSDFFDVLRSCIAVARIRARNPEILSAAEVLELGTIRGAEALGLGDEIGTLEPGKKADLQIIDMRQLGLTPTNDPVATLVYHAHAKDVELVMVDGSVRVRDGRVEGVDEPDVVASAGAAAEAAWARFAERHGGYTAPASS